MTRFFIHPFPFLDRFKHRLLHVLIILVFSMLFLITFEPFNIKAWLKYPDWLKGLGLISLSLTFSFIIAFSQLLIRTIVKVGEFKVYHLIAWLAAEILLLTIILTIIFADYSNGFLKEFLSTLKFTSSGLVLPYSFSILILMLLHKDKKGGNGTSELSPDTTDLIHFRDEREQVKFSLRKDHLLYLESSDNYVTIFFLEEDKDKKEMVRTSMKKLEPLLAPLGLVRCHRSFMVNMENVQWMKKEGRNYRIKMKNCDTIIPVSRGYSSTLSSMLLQ